MKLGDDYQYPIKGSGESSYKLDSGKSLTMKEVLFVPGLKKNLLSISALYAKLMRATFIDGQVIMWPICARNCFQTTKKQANTISNIQSNKTRF